MVTYGKYVGGIVGVHITMIQLNSKMYEIGPKNVTGTMKKLDGNTMVSRIKTGLNWSVGAKC